jgi:uncharacterized protein with NRDE domain
MCLILLSYGQHPQYPLVLAANRDEFYNRATEPARFWNDHPEVLAGRDLQAGGTWLGVTRSGRIAVITNYREKESFDPQSPTRGKLVSNFLTENISAPYYLESIRHNAKAYNGFNLITGDREGLYYFSNRNGSVQKLARGLFGLSNHLLDSPWPKVTRSKKQFELLLKPPAIDETAMFDLLSDTRTAPDEALPDTGVGLELERLLSPVFIKSPKYGTRCSTLITVDTNYKMIFVERTYDPIHAVWLEKRFELQWGRGL